MALNIKSDETDRLARQLAGLTGETITEAVTIALQDRLTRIEGRRLRPSLTVELKRIQERVATLPRLDDRSDDGILGYDQSGLPS